MRHDIKLIDLMRLVFFIAFVFGSKLVTAQVQQKNVVNRSFHLDTIRIAFPKDKDFTALNTKLHYYKMKTPMYNSMLTGTNAPGDVNTGISMDCPVNSAPETPAAQRIRIARDSANNISDNVHPLHK